jgi:hypothetical protein
VEETGVWWFSPGTLASSTTKTGRHDIAEILLKVALIYTLNQVFFRINLVSLIQEKLMFHSITSTFVFLN